jgi:hypothetical protein
MRRKQCRVPSDRSVRLTTGEGCSDPSGDAEGLGTGADAFLAPNWLLGNHLGARNLTPSQPEGVNRRVAPVPIPGCLSYQAER